MAGTPKSDQTRALREAKAERAERARSSAVTPIEKAVRRARAEKRGAHEADVRRDVATTVQELRQKIKRLTPHPDCQVCNARRERTKEAMRRRRKKQA
jgi:hypothetical protein